MLVVTCLYSFRSENFICKITEIRALFKGKLYVESLVEKDVEENLNQWENKLFLVIEELRVELLIELLWRKS
jgi:hypothetical protein